jgi:PAS domain S-box-containing protein
VTGAYVYSSGLWAPVFAATLLVALGWHSWRHRSVPGALPLAVASLIGIFWLLGIALETAAVEPASRIFWHKFQAVCQLPAVTATTCFALEYTWPGRWLTRRSLIILVIPPLVSLFMIVAYDSQLMWSSIQVGADGAVVSHNAIPGSILVAYGVNLVLINTTAFLWLFICSPQHRWPVALLLCGEITARGLYLFGQADPTSRGVLDPNVIGIIFVWIMYAIALFGFRILDPLPAAREAVIEQMREGTAVFDTEWRIANLNPAAASILSTSSVRAHGRTLQEVLPSLPNLESLLANRSTAATEISIGSDGGVRQYAVDHSPLKDFRGLLMGHLVLFRDVTEQRRAQAQILAEQWAEATLQERTQLAQELHDGLSQNLAFLNLQAQAAQLCLRSGQADAAQASLERLAEVARSMQGDTRELIGQLLAVSQPNEDLLSALRQILSDFEVRNGMHIALQLAADAETACGPNALSPESAVQIIRIAQEALANIRKHAGCPSEIFVRLSADDGRLRLAIIDNGIGFDPMEPDASGKHFGLQVMRQRAARIGGQVEVKSAPGQGTRVEVLVPLAKGNGTDPK